MTMPISTTNIDAAFSAAVAAAQALGNSVVRIAPAAVTPLDPGTAAETVETMPTKRGGQRGFQVTAVLQIGGYRVIRIHETLPVVRKTAWPSDIPEKAEKWTLDSITAGKNWIATQGYDAVDMLAVFNLFITALTAAGNDLAALAAAKPKLAAVYAWSQTVQSTAAAGGRMFPAAPYSFAEVLAEAHP